MSEPEVKEFNELLGAVTFKVADPRELALVRGDSILQNYVNCARRMADDIAAKYGLRCSYGQGRDDLRAIRPYRLLRLAFAPVGAIPENFVEFRFDLHSDDDVCVVMNSDAGWRGSDPTSPEFVEAIVRPVIELYLAAAE